WHIGRRRAVEVVDNAVVGDDERTEASGRNRQRRHRSRARERRGDRVLQEAAPAGGTFESHGFLGKMRRASVLMLRSASTVRRCSRPPRCGGKSSIRSSCRVSLAQSALYGSSPYNMSNSDAASSMAERIVRASTTTPTLYCRNRALKPCW